MPKEHKSWKKIKLFRIDGDIDIDEWISLLMAFYKGNEMLLEYFDPQQFDELFAEKIERWEIKDKSLLYEYGLLE
jgi:hypothetical protein